MTVLENVNEEWKKSYRKEHCFISSRKHKQEHDSEFPHYNAPLVKGGISTLTLRRVNFLNPPYLSIRGVVPFEIAGKSIVELARKMVDRGQPSHFDICSHNNAQHYPSFSNREMVICVEKNLTIESNLDLKKISNLFRKHFSIKDNYLLQDLNIAHRKFTFRYH